MQHYFATYWNGSEWTDLHSDPLPFKAAEDKATSALLNGCGTTRLRPADQPDYLKTISAELGIEWQLATAPAPLHRLRNTHGPSWLEGFTPPLNGLI